MWFNKGSMGRKKKGTDAKRCNVEGRLTIKKKQGKAWVEWEWGWYIHFRWGLNVYMRGLPNLERLINELETSKLCLWQGKGLQKKGEALIV